DLFQDGLPTATLPEGLRGEQLKITLGDDEAAGQIRLILGSYLENLVVTATGGTFKLSFGGFNTPDEPYNVSAANLQADLEALSSIGKRNVEVTLDGTGYHIALRGKLYLTYTRQFSVNPAGLTGGSASISIDKNTLKLNSPWSVEPTPTLAIFEVSLYSGVHVPNVKVRVYSKARPEVVVYETDGNTSVAEGSSSVATNHDTIRVRLSAPVTSPVDVNLGDNGLGLLGFDHSTLTFTASGLTSWDKFQDVIVSGLDDHVVRGFHKSDLTARATGYGTFLSTVSIADNDYVGVRVNESGGSTNVIEYTDTDFGLAQATALTDGFPFQDTYTLALSQAPQSGEVVTVTATAQPTRTSQTGGIVTYQQQLRVCLQ